MNHTLNIDLNRLKSTFEVSSKIGGTENDGLNRLGLTMEDKEIRDIFIKWLKDAGLSVRVDDLGNIYGRREGENPNSNSVMVGSHLDTQPKGGRFDGILGVLSALEVIRTLNENNIETERPIEIVNFTTEEGARFGIPMEGSGVVTGNYTKDYVYNLKDKDGVTFEQSLNDIGYVGDIKNRASNVENYVELHIEQGPILEKNNNEIGIVQGIKGITKYEVSIIGQASHAAYPPVGRRDALVAASEMVLMIDKITEQFNNMSATVGVFEVEPSKVSMSAGKVHFTFDARHIDDDTRKKAIAIIKEQLQSIAKSRHVDIDANQIWNMNSTSFSGEVFDLIEEGAKVHKNSYQYISSGAGHDAKFMKDIAKTGMIFAPSIKGLSHCEEEFTSFDHIEKVANVLLYVVQSLANRRS